MQGTFLEFEQPIAELEAKIEELRKLGNDAEVNVSEEIKRLEQERVKRIQSIFASLNAWQVVQLARHPERPRGPRRGAEPRGRCRTGRRRSP